MNGIEWMVDHMAALGGPALPANQPPQRKRREPQVYRAVEAGLAAGKSNRVIAREAGCSSATVQKLRQEARGRQ